MAEAFLVGGVRSPIGRYGGSLSAVRPDDLAALVMKTLIDRAGVADCTLIDEVIFGAANQAGEDNRNVARMSWLIAGLPDKVPGLTVNRLCGSGLSAIAIAASMVRAGDADLILAGGVESMSRAPWVLGKPTVAFGRPGSIFDTSIGWRFENPRLTDMDSGRATLSMPETAERVAEVEKIGRMDADAFSLRSHRLAVRAIKSGYFADEIVPVHIGLDESVREDQGPRADTSAAKLADLRPVVKQGGVVTAGNSSSLNDGAAAILVASERAIGRMGLTPRARVVSMSAAGVAPSVMGLGPIPASRKVLARAGWTVSDLGAVELNEAFATQSLACIRHLGLDMDIVNSNGGAIALGHPLGCSGTRILVTLLGRMEREDAFRGLATMCVGVGQGVAIAVERP